MGELLLGSTNDKSLGSSSYDESAFDPTHWVQQTRDVTCPVFIKIPILSGLK